MQQNRVLQFVKTNATLIALVVLAVALALADANRALAMLKHDELNGAAVLRVG